MLNLTFYAVALGFALLGCSAAQAQAQASLRPDAMNALAPVPALTYESPFAAYRRLAEQSKPLSWREANDAVGRIGGWRVYAREAQSPDTAPPLAPAPASASASAPAAAPTPVPAPALSTPAKPPHAHDHKTP
jgi:hypothetical protein